mgnify:CR=1 FL=1
MGEGLEGVLVGVGELYDFVLKGVFVHVDLMNMLILLLL